MVKDKIKVSFHYGFEEFDELIRNLIVMKLARYYTKDIVNEFKSTTLSIQYPEGGEECEENMEHRHICKGFYR